ncbi:cell division transport system permease protein [Luteimonas sp. J16]|jgi:cell division transport system permease protein|uniref:permease-like cell division protein FtsX n=1 Tax=unclassified Luteimonas TaxID=2629088 RepID=UPI00047E9A6C|nr:MULTISPECIES: permease-like cell division protein FtsX [unclassified Luteimonas]TWG89692.1 cell division transport system permease protein [Luteimonas sp. J16]
MSDPRATVPLRPPSPLRTWIDHHGYSLVASLGRVFDRPWAALLTIAVMALSLALPLGLALVLSNLERLAGNVERSREITVFLREDVDDARAAALAGELRGNGAVASVRHVTPQEGLESLRADPALAGVIDAVGDENPLPHALVVTPAGDELALAGWLRELPPVELVQHDAQWRQRLDTWLRFGARVAWVLAALFGLGALLVVGNTVRLDIQSRREEIGVLQLLGATDGFIRRPFLYLGAWYGLGAGALAVALLAGAGAALAGPLAELAASYGSRFALAGIDLPWTLAVLAGSTALGWLGAGLVTGHFLRQTRPTGT